MAVITAAVLRTPIRQHPQHRNIVFLEKRQYLVIYVSAAVTGVLLSYTLAKATEE